MNADDELRLVLKELFMTYETSYTIPGDQFNWMECSSCKQKGMHNEATGSFGKIRHLDNCPVRTMRLRIRSIINPRDGNEGN